MLLLQRMREYLEKAMYERKQRYMTKRHYAKLIEKLHLDATGQVVEPFVLLSDRKSREEREQLFYETLEDEIAFEEVPLIK